MIKCQQIMDISFAPGLCVIAYNVPCLNFMHYDCPFGGKLEGCFVPPRAIRIYFRVLRDVHSPFQSRSSTRLRSSPTSGIQNPVLYSRSSSSTRRLSKSSLVLEARPGLRSALNFALSSSSRFMYLVDHKP